MFFALETPLQIFIFATVMLSSFFLATTMNGILGRDGFGVYGNMTAIIAGFFIGVWIAHYFGYNVKNFKIGVVAGLISSFVSLLILSVLKSLLNRL